MTRPEKKSREIQASATLTLCLYLCTHTFCLLVRKFSIGDEKLYMVIKKELQINDEKLHVENKIMCKNSLSKR